jgi:methionine sulfoxide reductase heme-binding subunit
MLGWLTHGQLLWFANRGTGVVLVGLLTISAALGVFSTARASSTHWPRFATQALHRNISLLAAAMLTVHVASAVLDTYVDIRWWEAFVPRPGGYQQPWLGLGALALDLLLVIIVTSLLRHRLGRRTWRGIHLLSYLAWGVGVLHGVGIGSDSTTGWGMGTTVVSVGVVAAIGVIRLATLSHERGLASTTGYEAVAPSGPTTRAATTRRSRR